jgi:hypothetical protein
MLLHDPKLKIYGIQDMNKADAEIDKPRNLNLGFKEFGCNEDKFKTSNDGKPFAHLKTIRLTVPLYKSSDIMTSIYQEISLLYTYKFTEPSSLKTDSTCRKNYGASSKHIPT